MQHPRKIYFIDNGFIKFLSLNPERTRLMENLIAMELVRRGKELLYWKDYYGKEIDFVIKDKDKVKELIQASYNLSSPDTKEREISSLRKGMKEFKIKKGLIITYDEEKIIKEKNQEITIKPSWKWLLGL